MRSGQCPYPSLDSGEIEPMTDAQVANDNGDGGYNWIKVILLKIPLGLSGFWSFSFLVPQMAAEGHNFDDPQRAMAAACRLILGIVLVVAGLLA